MRHPIKVRLAKKIGFCFGVRRAIEMAKAALEENGEVYSLGSIIHNSRVVEELAKKGLRVVKDIGDVEKGVVVVSSHGISPRTADRIRSKGLRLIDTTCPFVLNAQRIARSLSDEGYVVIIAGEADHPEVRALVDFVSGDAHVVRDASAAGRLKLPRNKKISMISQTTQAVDNLIDIVNAVLRKRPKELRIVNTICRDVEERQAAARSLAEEVDAMLIVGGRNSANTKRLLGICRGISKWSYLVESAQEVKNEWFRNAGVVGITSGASTPAGIVREVAFKVNHCGKEEKSKRKGLYN